MAYRVNKHASNPDDLNLIPEIHSRRKGSTCMLWCTHTQSKKNKKQAFLKTEIV